MNGARAIGASWFSLSGELASTSTIKRPGPSTDVGELIVGSASDAAELGSRLAVVFDDDGVASATECSSLMRSCPQRAMIRAVTHKFFADSIIVMGNVAAQCCAFLSM